jgi:hypothetical protein
VTSSSISHRTKSSIAVVLIISILMSCSSGNNNSDEAKSTTTSSPPVVVMGEPVTDFNAIFEARSAVDHSFLSVDSKGIYGVIVTEKAFDFMQYMNNGWSSITSSVEGITKDNTGQFVDTILVEKAMDVTTRDYTGDRQSDFLIRFGSSFSKFGAIANSRNGVIELKPFCLSNPSAERPGVIRVFAVENLSYSDQYKIIEGDDILANGEHLREYWRWSKKNSCFKTTSSLG